MPGYPLPLVAVVAVANPAPPAARPNAFHRLADTHPASLQTSSLWCNDYKSHMAFVGSPGDAGAGAAPSESSSSDGRRDFWGSEPRLPPTPRTLASMTASLGV